MRIREKLRFEADDQYAKEMKINEHWRCLNSTRLLLLRHNLPLSIRNAKMSKTKSREKKTRFLRKRAWHKSLYSKICCLKLFSRSTEGSFAWNVSESSTQVESSLTASAILSLSRWRHAAIKRLKKGRRLSNDWLYWSIYYDSFRFPFRQKSINCSDSKVKTLSSDTKGRENVFQ